jgi:hypothetical protein
VGSERNGGLGMLLQMTMNCSVLMVCYLLITGTVLNLSDLHWQPHEMFFD